jgi:FlaA1/EpsC-like NDP-sugar epimerase
VSRCWATSTNFAVCVDEVLIALPQATPRMIRGLVEQCEGLGVLFRTVPPVTDLIAGRITVSQVRDVDIADLLGRAEVALDEEGIGEQLRGRRALVTGAGGSIGSEMCRQIAKFSPRRLILVEQAENGLFEIEREIRKLFPELDVVPYVADVIDRTRLGTIFSAEKPSVVFHAAAHKHVPMMERNPGEAIKNNVMGTIAVADMAAEHGVGRMVMISTDKAVNPTSVMGCTKRVAEIYVQALNDRVETQYITVRFGNVLGSSGSVVPIFKQQIASGGPVTVTHPDMTRYFMTIPEASQLVLQAGAMGKGGEIYVLHMGDPVKIVDLARDMITLSGLRPGTDIEIQFSGIRPGEKLFEELMIDGENVSETSHPKIGIWRPCLQDWDAVLDGVRRLKALADDSTNGRIQKELRRIVPEYNPGEPAPAPARRAAGVDAVTQS